MRRRGEEQATDIKSNNPHLAGGEKTPEPEGLTDLGCTSYQISWWIWALLDVSPSDI